MKKGTSSRKLFSQGRVAVRRLNGHPNADDVALIRKCGEELEHLRSASLKAFCDMETKRKRTVKGAVKTALGKRDLTDAEAFGDFGRLIGFCKNPLHRDLDRKSLAKFLEYFASTKQ